MGYYISPNGETKEAWLARYGTPINEAHAQKLDEHGTLVPVCLVDNALFTAAAIGYSKAETQAFCNPADHRPRKWFAVSREHILDVCPAIAREWQSA